MNSNKWKNLYFNGKKLTDESIAKAKQWYIDNARACIAEAVSGEVRVNDLPSYIKWREEQIKAWENDIVTISLSFLQQAYYLQTGKSIALLP